METYLEDEAEPTFILCTEDRTFSLLGQKLTGILVAKMHQRGRVFKDAVARAERARSRRRASLESCSRIPESRGGVRRGEGGLLEGAGGKAFVDGAGEGVPHHLHLVHSDTAQVEEAIPDQTGSGNPGSNFPRLRTALR